MHATESATATPGSATPPPVRTGLVREQQGSHSNSPAPHGARRLASDMRRLAAMSRQGSSQTVLAAGGQGSPMPSALGISVATADTTLEAVSQVQRQRDQDRRLFDRRLLQLEQRVDTLLSEKDSIADWRKKLAEVNGFFSGLQGEVHGLARHLETVEEMLHGRNSTMDLLRQRAQETEQQVQSMEKRVRHCDISMKEVDRGMHKLRGMEQSLEEHAQRLHNLEEEVKARPQTVGGVVKYNGQHILDMIELQQRIDGLEAVQELPRFAPSSTQDFTQITSSICELAEQVGHLAQRAAGFEATQVSLQHKVGEVAGRLATMGGGSGFYELQPAQAEDLSESHGGSEATAVLKELRGQLDDLSNFVLELSAKQESPSEGVDALRDEVARQEETMDLYISYIKCVASDHSDQVLNLVGRISEVEKHVSSPLQEAGQSAQSLMNSTFLSSVRAQLAEVQEELLEVRAQVAETHGNHAPPPGMQDVCFHEDDVQMHQETAELLKQEMLHLQKRVNWLEAHLTDDALEQALQAMPGIVQAAQSVEQAQSNMCDVIEQVNHLSHRMVEGEAVHHELQQTVSELVGQAAASHIAVEGCSAHLADVVEKVQGLSEQVLEVQGRMDEAIPSCLHETAAALGSKLQLDPNLLNTMRDLDPLQIDIALEHLQLTCLAAADDIASAVRLEFQDVEDGLTSKGRVEAMQGGWQLSAVDGLNGDDAEEPDI
mmetsp:Transcript_27700/g.61035  ORF Transcript_27700/g.61035 Transcript_27700/m.61035 type:complete len:716 (-) Transcript_27700:54-2201(-)